MVLTSKGDNITIENLESLRGTGNFTSLKIDKLISSINLSNKSGETEIETVNPGFESISLTGQFNDYILNLNNLNYTLTADLEFTDLKSSEEIFKTLERKKLLNGKATINKQIGDQSGDSQINLKCSNCNVVLR